MAGGLIRCEELAVALGPGQVEGLDDIRRALDDVPAAVAWARQILEPGPIPAARFRKNTAPTMIRCSVLGVAAGAAADVDARLRDLLVRGIEVARPQPAPVRIPVRAR